MIIIHQVHSILYENCLKRGSNYAQPAMEFQLGIDSSMQTMNLRALNLEFLKSSVVLARVKF